MSQHHSIAMTSSHSRRALRRTGAALTALAAVMAAGLATAPTAAAHVRVVPESTAGGSFSKLTFRVPNESDTAGTVSLVVTLPESAPLAFVSTQPVAGWTAKVTTAKLAKPIEVHGTPIAEAARTVTWTAAKGTQIAPGQFQEFAISAGPLPESGELVFSAVQTYSDGEIVAWDQPTPEGGAEPERPAPAFAVTPAEDDAHGGTASDAEEPAAAPAADTTDEDGGAALWLAAAALLVGAGGVLVGALGWRRAGQQR